MICQTQFSRPKPSPWSQVRSNKTLQHSHASWACSQIHLFHFHTCPAPPSSTKNLSQSQSDVVPLKSDEALSFILAQLLQRQKPSQTDPTPAEVLSALGMDWEIVCAETNLVHPEMGMIPVNRHPLLSAQPAITQGSDGMNLGCGALTSQDSQINER